MVNMKEERAESNSSGSLWRGRIIVQSSKTNMTSSHMGVSIIV